MLLSEEFKRMAKLAGAQAKPEVMSELNVDDVHIPPRYVQDSLNQDVWKDKELRADVKEALLKIAYEFYKSLEISAPIGDIKIVGSMANYNWSPSSDIDVHLFFNLTDINQDVALAKEFLESKKELWKLKHNILVKGFDVELYAQDISDKYFSGGIYSLAHDTWEVKPDRNKPEIDKAAVKAKSAFLASQIEGLQREGLDAKELYGRAKDLKDKIKRMRQCGLEKGGEFSVENLAFKYLRNEGYLDTLRDIANKAYDEMLSLGQ